MERIETTIGYIEIYDGGFRSYVGDSTDNGECFKDMSAWERGGYDDILYISENNLKARTLGEDNCAWTKPHLLACVRAEVEAVGLPVDEEFVERIAYYILQVCDWQDLSVKLAEIDLIEEFEYFMEK